MNIFSNLDWKKIAITTVVILLIIVVIYFIRKSYTTDNKAKVQQRLAIARAMQSPAPTAELPESVRFGDVLDAITDVYNQRTAPATA